VLRLTLLLAFAASAAFAAAPPDVRTDGLTPMKRWTVYDEDPSKDLDLARLCRAARLSCGAVLPPGERLAAKAEKIGGENAYDLLMRILAAHPGYRASFEEGALNVSRDGDLCARALERPARRARYPNLSDPAVAAEILRAAGFEEPARGMLTSTLDPSDAARFLDLDFEVRGGASVRRALDGVASTDGLMMWIAESEPSCSGAKPRASPCRAFRAADWRPPQALERPPRRGWTPDGVPLPHLMRDHAEVAPPAPVMLESHP
jgi:hypothetical protein